MGPEHPKVPGYDPVTQALCGYMDLTGEADGPPLLCGPPIVDLKAGDEAFAQICLALLEKAEGGGGKRIDVSMARAAVAWLQTFVPMLDMDSPPEELRRSARICTPTPVRSASTLTDSPPWWPPQTSAPPAQCPSVPPRRVR